MTTVYLIRHAEAEGNVYRRCHGWYNSLITVNGYRQIEALQKRFQDVHVDEVWSSDLFRTMTTAGAVYKPKGLPLRTDPGLREIGCGIWEDRTWGELYHTAPDLLMPFFRSDLDWRVEGSETYGGLMERMASTLRRIAAENEGRTVAAVSHGAAIRAAIAGLDSGDAGQIVDIPQGDNTSVTKLVFRDGRAEIEYMNDNSHLAELSTLGRQGWKKGGIDDFLSANLWFRPLDFNGEADIYREARREAWETIHGTMKGFHGDAFLDDARENSLYDPQSVVVVMRGEVPAGVLQMDLRRGAEKGIGRIPFLYLMPGNRAQGLGVQLLGQAVSTFRPLDRQFLRLRCAPENLRARRFYERYGFYKVGTEPGGLGSLDVLEKFIGYEMNGPVK